MLVIQTQKRMALLVKNVKEAFPFRPLQTIVGKTNARFFIFLELPFWLKQFWYNAEPGRDTAIFNNITWACQFIWGASFSASYLYFMTYNVVKAAKRSRVRSVYAVVTS